MTRPAVRRLAIGAFALLAACPLIAAAVLGTVSFRPDGSVLEIEMRAIGGTKAELFWATTDRYTPQESFTIPLHQAADAYERLRFPLPDVRIWMVRFDPLDGPGEARIRSVRVLDRDGRIVRTIDPILLEPLNEIDRVVAAPDGGLRIVTTAAATDPMLNCRGVWLTAPPAWYSLRLVTPLSLAWIAAASLAVVAAGLVLVARDVASGAFYLRDALWLGALFCAVLAGKLALVAHYPAPVPYWDQWIGEATGLYLPYANGGLTWAQMFHLHNEHRIFFTRVLAMALLVLNGQWDPQLQMVVNAAIHALVAVLLATILWLSAGRRLLPLVVLAVGLAFAPAFGVENTIAGFQSAFYLLLLFSLLAFWLMLEREPGSPGWALGWLCAFSALFTLAGGVLIVVALAVALLLDTFNRPDPLRRIAISCAALVAVGAVAVLTGSPALASHQHMAAASLTDFRIALARNLAFPWVWRQRLAPLVWAPLLAVAATVVLRRLATSRIERVTLALGAWVALQAAALAYSRGVGGGWPASRYLDMLTFGFVANTAALVALFLSRPAGSWRRALGVGLVVWMAAAAAGIAELSRLYVSADAVQRRAWMRESVKNVRQFVVAGDAHTLAGKTGPLEIPFYDAKMLMAWLSHPVIRQALPAAIRAPLHLVPSGPSIGFAATSSSTDLLPVWNSGVGGPEAGVGRFESEPIRCLEFNRIRFELGGSPGAAGTRLFLRSTTTGRETPISPSFGLRPGWSAATVGCLDGPFTVVAVDDSPAAGFAFTEPSEIAWASSVAEWMIHRYGLWGTFSVTLMLIAASRFARRRAASGERRTPGGGPV